MSMEELHEIEDAVTELERRSSGRAIISNAVCAVAGIPVAWWYLRYGFQGFPNVFMAVLFVATAVAGAWQIPGHWRRWTYLRNAPGSPDPDPATVAPDPEARARVRDLLLTLEGLGKRPVLGETRRRIDALRARLEPYRARLAPPEEDKLGSLATRRSELEKTIDELRLEFWRWPFIGPAIAGILIAPFLGGAVRSLLWYVVCLVVLSPLVWWVVREQRRRRRRARALEEELEALEEAGAAAALKKLEGGAPVGAEGT